MPVQVGSPAWAGTLTASHAALVRLKKLQVASRFLAAVRVAVRYFLYVMPLVFSSMPP